MSKKKSDATAQQTEPIKFETVYPIHIRTKDGALAFDPPGEPVKFEEHPDIKITLLAHKMNELIIQMHRMQRVVFANNKILAEILRKKSNGSEETSSTEKANDQS